MSVKKRTPSLCKFSSTILDETDVDSFLSQSFWHFPGASIEQCELAEPLTKLVCNQVVPVLRCKDTETFYHRRKSEYPQKRTHFFGRQSAQFSQNFRSR